MFSDPSRICKEKCKRTCLRRKKKMFWHYLCWERKNINHLAENSFQRNLGVPEGPSNESPVSIWTFQGLSKANWKAKPWESSSPAFAPPRPPHPARLALVFFESIGKCWHLAFYWVANLDFDIRPDPQSLRESRNKGLLPNKLDTREISQWLQIHCGIQNVSLWNK